MPLIICLVFSGLIGQYYWAMEQEADVVAWQLDYVIANHCIKTTLSTDDKNPWMFCKDTMQIILLKR